MENAEKNIKTEFLDYFKYEEKILDNYEWNIISVSKDTQNSRIVFCGENKQNNDDCIYVKQFKLFFSYNNNDISSILKEIYFLTLLKNKEYFVKLTDIVLDDQTNCNRIFLVFKGNCVSLNKLIDFKKDDYLSNYELIKWIIYQISYGLYILHSNNIIHNDIKPSNILINEEGGITICDFGSASYKNQESNSYTRYYSSPEFLNNTNLIRDEKYDMWALGVIIVELFLKTNRYFSSDNEEKTIENQLKIIFSKFGIENIQKEEIQKIIEDDINYEKYKFKNEEVIKNIEDKDAIDLISHLLVINPKKRYTAEEVLNSPYLSDYKDYENSDVKIKDDIIDYDNINDSLISKENFIKIFAILKSRI